MTTWADLRGELREDLEDTGATPRWSDKQLWLWTRDAVNDYSVWFPIRKDRVQMTEVNGSYPLPADFLEAIFVEVPKDRYLEELPARPGIRFSTRQGRPFYYHIEGGNLYLDGSPLQGDEVLLTYYASHPVPASETDDAFVFTVPDRDMELIRLYVRAKAMEQMRTRTAQLDRFKSAPTAGSNRQDNPLSPEVESLMNEYYAKIAMRIPGGTIRLYRTGRIR